MTGYSFQTRARTIDHLGRGQIADSPTAISELWKNAYDAYARSVSLHIFDGMPEVAAIFDDGVGMDKEDFLTKWLVIGTESKVETTVDPTREPPETFGLRPRPRQGEKGIGRLSAAFLAPCTLVVSKKRDGGYVVVIVDWRLFENPYLALSDIVVPIEEFEHPEDILPGLEGMIATIRGNLGGKGDDGQTTHAHALEIAWDRFSAQETEAGRSSTTRDAVRRTWASLPLNDGHLEEWPVFLGEGDHGTALFLIEIQDDLRAWLHPDSEDEKPVRDRLRETLTGFTDPFVPFAKSEETELKGGERARLDFDYEVLVRSNGRNISVLRTDAIFGLDDLHGLEHHLDGEFDADGLFEGKVVAYGRDLGVQRIPPPTVMTRSDREQIGPFAFCIGTFEQDEIRSTHQGSEFAALIAKSQEFVGIAVYRDGLRVMPYGRHDSDFFAIEERRSKHTGREFWSHRRSFGRVAFTRRGNPNLKDKAGREGLVDNKAKALLRGLVVNVLRTSARNYFGTDSDHRKNYLPEIEARNVAARKSAERLTKRRRTDVRGFLREQAPLLATSLAEVKQLTVDAAETLQKADRERAAIVLSRYRDLSSVRDNLRPPPAPANLKDAEAKYRSYRDDYREYLASLSEVSQISVKIEAEVGSLTPEETAKTVFSRNQSLLNGRIDGQIKAFEGKIEELRNYWRNQASEDRRRYYESNRDIMSGDIEALGLARILNILDRSRLELEDEVGNRYRAILAAVDSLLQGIDLEGAAIVASDDAAALEERVREIHAVALSGIAVEIIGHELEALDGETRRYLLKLPEPVRQSSAFKLGFEAHNALADKLRVLSPLKIAGYRNRETIKGGQIADYVEEFFANNFNSNRIDFKASEAFRNIEISDLRSRIYPVFINIVNNAAYWCTRSDDRRIILDLRDGKAVIGDTGPGVDPDDVERIFDLFYTRRFGGRGVGLYLCRVNLGVAGHSIRYATESDPHILPGGNFIIEFKGLGKNA